MSGPNDWKQCPKCKGMLEDDGSCSCGYGKRRRHTSQKKEIDRTCPWNDHGDICGLVGSLSDTTNGDGPWYCATHFWKLKGYPETARATLKPAMNYRQREFPDAAPPNLESCGTLRSVAAGAGELLQRMHSGTIGKRTREPGEDDTYLQP